jgi:hypothetical protein
MILYVIGVGLSGFGYWEILNLHRNIDSYPIYENHKRLYFSIQELIMNGLPNLSVIFVLK